MAIDNDNDPVAQYQIQTKMFYYITVSGLHRYMVENNLPINGFARQIGRAYRTLCQMTGRWHEDEQYKSDPRWKL